LITWKAIQKIFWIDEVQVFLIRGNPNFVTKAKTLRSNKEGELWDFPAQPDANSFCLQPLLPPIFLAAIWQLEAREISRTRRVKLTQGYGG
jgi:hypothetical protein